MKKKILLILITVFLLAFFVGGVQEKINQIMGTKKQLFNQKTMNQQKIIMKLKLVKIMLNRRILLREVVILLIVI